MFGGVKWHYLALCALFLSDVVSARHSNSALTRRRGHHISNLVSRDAPIIWNDASGPLSWDYDNMHDSIPKDKAIAAITYAMVKCNHLWIVDLMGKKGGATPPDPVEGYTATEASYSIFDKNYYRHQVKVPINSSTVPQWGIGYQAAYEAALKITDTNFVVTGAEGNDVAQKLRAISGYPTRKFDKTNVSDKTNLGYLLMRSDETPILGVHADGLVSAIVHPNPNGTYDVWSSGTKTPWSLDDLYDKTKIDYFVSFTDFQRWTQSAFAWNSTNPPR